MIGGNSSNLIANLGHVSDVLFYCFNKCPKDINWLLTLVDIICHMKLKKVPRLATSHDQTSPKCTRHNLIAPLFLVRH
jgi:hypothetical protein